MTDTAAGIPLIEPQTTDAIQQANDGFARLDDRFAGELTIDFASDANYTLASSSNSNATAHEWAVYHLKFTDSGTVLTTGRQVIFPTGITGNFLFTNSTAQTLTLTVSGGSETLDVASGSVASVYLSGDELYQMPGGSGGGGAVTSIISPDTSTTHTAKLGDNGGLVLFNSSSDCTLTVPQQSSEALTAGFHLLAKNIGGGNLILALQGSDTCDSVLLWQDPELPVTVLLQDDSDPNAWTMIGNSWIVADVVDDALTAPPGTTPAVGAVYIPAATATGSWAGHENEFAIHTGSDNYVFVTPFVGQIVYENTTGALIYRNGSAWGAV